MKTPLESQTEIDRNWRAAMAGYRTEARRQMSAVAIVLICAATFLGGLLYHFLTR